MIAIETVLPRERERPSKHYLDKRISPTKYQIKGTTYTYNQMALLLRSKCCGAEGGKEPLPRKHGKGLGHFTNSRILKWTHVFTYVIVAMYRIFG